MKTFERNNVKPLTKTNKNNDAVNQQKNATVSQVAQKVTTPKMNKTVDYNPQRSNEKNKPTKANHSKKTTEITGKNHEQKYKKVGEKSSYKKSVNKTYEKHVGKRHDKTARPYDKNKTKILINNQGNRQNQFKKQQYYTAKKLSINK